MLQELRSKKASASVPVRLDGNCACPEDIWMSHRDAEFGSELANRAEIAKRWGFSETDLMPR